MKITVVSPAGAESIIDARVAGTLMEAIRDSGIEIVAQCGGGCACATCHVHVDPEWGERLTPATDQEVELIEGSDNYDPSTSRLSCQIVCTPELEGLIVRVDEEAWEE